MATRRWAAAAMLAAALGAPVRARPDPAVEAALPPAPELPASPFAGSEALVETLPAGDPRRADLFVQLAVRRFEEAEQLAAGERAAGARTTPRADARRAEAARLAERALEEGGEFARAPEALLVAGLADARVGRRRDALRMLGALVRRYPDGALAADAWVALGEQHLEDGDLTRARAALEAASRGPRPAVRAFAWARLADVALLAGDPDGALDLLGGALEGGSPRAAATLERVAAAPGPLGGGDSAALRLATLCERAGDLAGARALRERVAAAAGRGAAAEEASAELDRMRAAALPAGPPPPLPAGAGLRAGPPPALDRLHAIAAAASGEPAGWYALGRAALDEGRAADARVLLERAAVALAPGDPFAAAAANDLGLARMTLGDLEGARAALARAVELAPAWSVARENLGAAALADGDAAAAEPALAQAVAEEPARWQARLLHALALAGCGRSGDALAEAARVLDLERGQPAALALEAGLRATGAAAGQGGAGRGGDGPRSVSGRTSP